MSRRIPILLQAVAVLLPFGNPASAQNDPGLPSTVVPFPPRLVDPPRLSGSAEWVLLVHQSGGFAGVSQNLIVDSTGVLRCSGFRDTCAGSIDSDTLAILDGIVNTATPGDWAGSFLPCSDCLNRMLVLVERNPTGETTRHTAYWTVSSSSPDAGELHRVVRDLVFPD